MKQVTTTLNFEEITGYIKEIISDGILNPQRLDKRSWKGLKVQVTDKDGRFLKTLHTYNQNKYIVGDYIKLYKNNRYNFIITEDEFVELELQRSKVLKEKIKKFNFTKEFLNTKDEDFVNKMNGTFKQMLKEWDITDHSYQGFADLLLYDQTDFIRLIDWIKNLAFDRLEKNNL